MRVTTISWIAACVWLLTVSGPAAAATSMADVIAATYGGYSVSPPTPERVIVCHGFGCQYRAEVALTDQDRTVLKRLLAPGKASAEAERQAVAKAGAWFDRRIGPAAGTQDHVARAGYQYMYDKGQFDCIDASRNTTSLLLLLLQLDLLHHHFVDVPVARGFIFDGVPPHVTAVLTENETGRQWAVDSWTRGYGEPPEIMPLLEWRRLK